MNYEEKFDSGLTYTEFLAKYGSDLHQSRWNSALEQIQLSPAQQELLAGFTREMKVMVLAGAWCGDCAGQCPIFERFAQANPKIQVRYYDRDDNTDLGDQLSTCGAHRVPSVLFLSEDDFPCGRYGDKTLAKFRDLVEKASGNACLTGIGGEAQELQTAIIQEWLDQFERIQLMLRMSGRLREKHGD